MSEDKHSVGKKTVVGLDSILAEKEQTSCEDSMGSENVKIDKELESKKGTGLGYFFESENHQEVLNYDGRDEGEWQSRWSTKARRIIYIEALYTSGK